MNAPNLIECRQLTAEWMQRAGKFYAMHTGTSADLISFQDGRIELEVRMPDGQWETRGPYLTRRIADSWKNGEPFRSATRYRAFVYRRQRPAGFAVAPGKGREALIRHIVAICAEAEKPSVDILAAVIEASFEDPLPALP